MTIDRFGRGVNEPTNERPSASAGPEETAADGRRDAAN